MENKDQGKELEKIIFTNIIIKKVREITRKLPSNDFQLFTTSTDQIIAKTDTTIHIKTDEKDNIRIEYEIVQNGRYVISRYGKEYKATRAGVKFEIIAQSIQNIQFAYATDDNEFKYKDAMGRLFLVQQVVEDIEKIY